MRRKILKSDIFVFTGFFVLILFFFYGPFSAHTTYAAFEFIDIGAGVLKKLVAGIGGIVIHIASWFLALSGWIFDYTIQFSILNYFGEGGFVEKGWTTVRDLSNVVFIFILLYAAFMTVLGMGGVDIKKVVANVVLIALLVNFSLVITKVVIDANNILAVEFYNKLNNIEDASNPGKKLTLSEGISNALSPQNFFKQPEDNSSFWGEIFSRGAEADEESTLMQIAISTIFGSIFILALAFVLLAGGLMFILRTAALWLVMILSPAAFVCYAVPGAEKFFTKWKGHLINHALFAPAYMFYLYVVVKIVSESNLLSSTGRENVHLSADAKDLDTASMGLIFKYLIVLFLLTMALKLASDMGAYGASAANKYFDKGKGWLTGKAKRISQKVPGGASRVLLSNQKTRQALQSFAASSPRVGGAISRTVRSGAKLGLNEELIKARAETAKSLTPEQQAKYFAKLGRVPFAGRLQGASSNVPGLKQAAFVLSPVAAIMNFLGGDNQSQKRMLEEMSSSQRRKFVAEADKDTGARALVNKYLLEKEILDKLSSEEKMEFYARGENDPTIAKDPSNVEFRKGMEKKILENTEEFQKLSIRDRVEFGKMIDKMGGDVALFNKAVDKMSKEDKENYTKTKNEVGRKEKIGDFLLKTDPISGNPISVPDLSDKSVLGRFNNIKPDEIQTLRDDLFTDSNVDYMLDNLRTEHFNKIMARGDESSDKFIERVIAKAPGAKSPDDVSKAWKTISPSVSAWAISPAGRYALESRLP